MTDERKPEKPETPGMAEVSAKFVHEAEAAVETAPSSASVPGDPLLALRAEWKRLAAELKTTIESGGEDDPLWARIQDVETRILAAEPQTLLGALVQIEVLAEFTHEGVPFFGAEIVASMVKQTPARIERLLAAPGDPILALKREWETRYKALDEHRDDPDTDESDKAVQPFYDRLHESEVQILRTQATTPAGVAVKLILWARLHCDADEVSGLNWTRKSLEGEPHDLDRLPVLSALLDLERMAGEGAAKFGATVPPASPLLSHISDMETPIIVAEGAIKALVQLVNIGGDAEGIVYLVGQLQQNIEEERRLFDDLFVAASGSEA